MKAIKILFFLIILGLIGTLGYQNQDYFLTTAALHIDLKVSSLQYTAQALPNWAFWGICFGLGLLITGMRGLFTAFRLGREITTKDAKLTELQAQINTLKTELEVFTHDPYIKNQKKADTGVKEEEIAVETAKEERPQQGESQS